MENKAQYVEQAYLALGLGAGAEIGEVEKRYERIVRESRAKQIRGTLLAEDEAALSRASEAYRLILEERSRRLAEAYRARRYGRFKRWAHLAEAADQFLTNRRFEIFASLFFVAALAFGPAILPSLAAERPAAALRPAADLTVVLAGADLPRRFAPEDAAGNREWLELVPGLSRIDVRGIPFPPAEAEDNPKIRSMRQKSEIALLAENPDLYIVDRANFSRLVRLGFLARLDEWDTYGVDVSEGAPAVLRNVPFRPAIAAVSAGAGHPDRAKAFIRALLPGDAARGSGR